MGKSQSKGQADKTLPAECLKPRASQLQGACYWDPKVLKKMILDKKLAPFYEGQNDEADELEECPICFLVRCGVHATCVLFSRCRGVTLPSTGAWPEARARRTCHGAC